MIDDGCQPLLLPSGKHLGGPKCLSGVSLEGKGSGDSCNPHRCPSPCPREGSLSPQKNLHGHSFGGLLNPHRKRGDAACHPGNQEDKGFC